MRGTSKAGFTTIEVLIAIAIIGFLLAPLLVMQTSSLETVARYSSSLDRIFLAKSFLHQARRVTNQQSSQQQSGQAGQSTGSRASQAPSGAASSQEDQRFSFSAEELDPVTHLIYERSPVPKNSDLANIPGLMLEKIDAIGAQSRAGMRKPVERLVSFMYVPITYSEREKA